MVGRIRIVRLISLPMVTRIVWGGMVLLHAPIFAFVCLSLLRDGADLSRIWSSISLAASLVFFVLKLQDAAFLRIGSTRSAWIAVVLITALLHQAALFRRFGGEQTAPVTWATVVTITVAGSGRAAWRGRHVLHDWKRWLALGFARANALGATGDVASYSSRVPIFAGSVAVAGPRAPPH